MFDPKLAEKGPTYGAGGNSPKRPKKLSIFCFNFDSIFFIAKFFLWAIKREWASSSPRVLTPVRHEPLGNLQHTDQRSIVVVVFWCDGLTFQKNHNSAIQFPKFIWYVKARFWTHPMKTRGDHKYANMIFSKIPTIPGKLIILKKKSIAMNPP